MIYYVIFLAGCVCSIAAGVKSPRLEPVLLAIAGVALINIALTHWMGP